jgi:mono/diheme cytochrome c family protein
MKTIFSLLLLALVAAGSARTSSQSAAPAPPRPSTDAAAAIVRGEYLANSVAMCVQCHSPRDEHGTILEAQKFRGGAMPVIGPYPNQPWALRTPNIAGLLGFTDEQILGLLMNGRMDGREPPKPPMPPFRMNRQDAEAIVAYLRTR